MTGNFFSSLRNLLVNFHSMREREAELAKENQFLAEALDREKHEGHRIAVVVRTISLSLVALFLPFITPFPHVLYYEAFVILFIAVGWLQIRIASVGYSRLELALIFLDLGLLTFIIVVPNPFIEEVPTALLYRFENFIYFFIFLAIGTLAYSWRTVWAIGVWVAGLWIVGVIGVAWFGHEMPHLTTAANEAFKGHNIVGFLLDPNGLQYEVRTQEIVIFLIVAGVLAVKGWRSNQLLIRQANLAVQRANLSRYFSSNLVDVLASTDHDIGAVRSQDVAVLFTDIVGFTEFAERHSPTEVMEFLRFYHAFVERAIFQNNGTLEKYLGDGVMATFGTPQTGADDAKNALMAARQIIRETEAFNKTRDEEGHSPILVSIGVHYGPVILGDIGPSRRLEFAVVGDTVNVASRLEATTRNLECQCIVSDELMKNAHLDDVENFDEIHKFKLKQQLVLRGRQTPIDVWVT